MSLIHLLAEHPQIQSRMQREIDDVIGERDARIKDSNNEAVILETLRYISHAPLAIPHYTSEDCTISGHAVSKGTTVSKN
jgi:cytochrome P450